jgi:Kef-type K+ transport system membrane component KefB/mannitol/fructose-specific phosphotransferase system IIA component (Ntr-type)
MTVTTIAAGTLTPHDITAFLLAIAVLLGLARILGELARQLRQPAVLGEIIAGVLLGKTVLGHPLVSPEAHAWLFPVDGKVAIALHALVTLSATMLLLAAGLEVDLGKVWRQGVTALIVAVAGVSVPFVLGSTTAWFLPEVLGLADPQMRLPFALFVGIALSITALPVIAKILVDLNLSKSDLGTLIMASAMLTDLIGWIAFALVLALMSSLGAAPASGATVSADAAKTASGGVALTVAMTLTFIAAMLTVGRWLFHKWLPYVQAYWDYPGGVLVAVMIVGLFCAGFTEYIGVHSIFGAFIAGVAIGDTAHLRQRTRDVIHQFIMNIFAPLFFASIGLHINFLTAFNPVMVGLVLGIALTGKVGATFLAGRICRMPQRESLAVGFGMAAQGALGIILGELALQAGVIGQQLFVAIVTMALITSLISGPAIQRLLKQKPKRHLGELLSERQFITRLQARTVREVIAELSMVAAKATGLPFATIDQAVWQREQQVHTGLGQGIAVPHARLASLKRPLIVVGRSDSGIDFDAADGEPARVICLLLTPYDQPQAQLELLDLVARAFARPERRAAALQAQSFTEFRAGLNLAHSTDRDQHES